MRKKSWQSLLWLGFLSLALALSGCGDNDYKPRSETSAPESAAQTVSGVAAAGAPLIGWVTLADSDGVQRGPVQLERDGSFEFDVEGLTPPFYLLAEGTAGMAEFHLHQVARTEGTSNINPITDLIAKTATDGKIAEILPEGMTTDETIVGKSPAAVVDADAVQAALDEAAIAFQAMLQPLLDQFDATIDDYMNNLFAADGTGADQFFDTVEVAVSNNGGLFNTYEVIDKATKTAVATGEMQLDAVKTASPIDETVAAEVKVVKTDMDEIGPFLAEFLTGVKNATGQWVSAYQAANSNATLEDQADQAFIDAISQHYVSDPAAFGWNDGVELEAELWGWLEDWEDNLLIEGLSNLAVIEKGENGRYLLTGIFLWNGYKDPVRTPIAVIKEGDVWKVTGNGYLIDCDLMAETERIIWTDGNYNDVSGFNFDITSHNPEVHYAVAFGPGMPANGLVLDPARILGDDMWVNSNDRFSYPNGYTRYSFYVPDNVNDVSFGDIYTWEVYDSADNLLQTVTSRLEGKLIDLAAKTATEKDALFPTIDNIATQSLDWFTANVFGGQYTFDYTASETAAGELWLEVGWWDNAAGFWNDIEFNTDSSTQTATAYMGPAPASLGSVDLEIGTWSSTYGDIETSYEFTMDSQGNYQGMSHDYAVEYQMLRRETGSSDNYKVYIGLTQDGQLLDPQNLLGIGAPNMGGLYNLQAKTYEYVSANCSTTPCTWSDYVESGVSFAHDALSLGTYTITLNLQGGELTTVIPFLEEVVLPTVGETSMSATWQGGDLVLNWTNPTTSQEWSRVTNLRVGIKDLSGKFVGWVKLAPTQETITLPAAMVQDMRLTGDGSLAYWDIQTRTYTGNPENSQIARGYSAQVALP